VIALQIKNGLLPDLKNITALNKLNWLILHNCGLKSLSGLNLPLLQRLSVSNNQLSNLDGIETSPDLDWLEYANNPITDSSAAKAVTDKNLNVH
jgi:Leucine-rich repeat (LRR) protein